uniref:Reverse transcriptase domain-containing protein n=1 Tax=Tanacetum cinerariifolium TaxID=118510 RepID=A0A6L2J1L9_TANCI|nr:hypothetical protein [Tanacetum cinerariifolium]
MIKPICGKMCQGVRKEIQTKGVIGDSIHFDTLGDMQEFVKMLVSIVTWKTMKLARIMDLLNHVILKSKVRCLNSSRGNWSTPTGNGYDKKGTKSKQKQTKPSTKRKAWESQQPKVNKKSNLKSRSQGNQKVKEIKEEGHKLPISKVMYKEEDRYKDLLRACPHHGFTELHQLNTFYNAINPADQDSLNAAAGGYLLERRTQDVLTIIENKSKQTSVVTTAMTAILKQFQATPPPASEKAVEEICVTCGGAHPYYQCLAAGSNTFLELQDNIQGYVLAAAVNYNQGNAVYRPPGMANQIRPPGFAQPNASMSNQTNEIKNMMASLFQMNTASTSGSGSLPSNTVANSKGKLKAITTRSGLVLDGPTIPTPPPFINPKEDERTLTDPDLSEYTIKVPPPPVQKYKPPSQRDYVVHRRDHLHPNIPYPSRMLKQKQQEKDEVQIYKFWQMFKQLHINITLADALILMHKYQKMLKALLSNKEKLQELANTPLNENCSAVILKKLPKKLEDPGKFFIPYGFSLPELISTRMTLELANRAICTPVGIARDVFIPIGKFTFPTDFGIVIYESDPRVPLILGRPFLWTARALIDVHGEEMILRDGDERLTLNMRHDTSSYSNQPQKESINLINVFNNSKIPLILHPSLLDELVDELALITFRMKYDDDLQFDVEFDLKEIEFMLHQDIDSSLKDLIDQSNLANPADNFVDSMLEMFTDEHALDYSFPLIFDEYDDDFLEVGSDNENVYDDPFDSKGEKIKESKLLIDELDLPCDFLPSEYDSFISQDFSRVDAKPSTNNEDKVFNPGILSQENPFEIITRVVQDKKLAISNASLVLEDFDPPLYEPLFFKEVPRSKMLLPFSSEKEEKVFKPGTHTSKKVHSSRGIGEQEHMGYVGEVRECLCTAQVQGNSWDDGGIVFVVLAGDSVKTGMTRG